MISRLFRLVSALLLVVTLMMGVFLLMSSVGALLVYNGPGILVFVLPHDDHVHYRTLRASTSTIQYRVDRRLGSQPRSADYYTKRRTVKPGLSPYVGFRLLTFEIGSPNGAMIEWSFTRWPLPEHRLYRRSWRVSPVSGQASERAISVRWALYLAWLYPHLMLIRYLYRVELRRYRERCHRLGVCFNCGYDLTGNISGTCPECGTPIQREVETRGPLPGADSRVIHGVEDRMER